MRASELFSVEGKTALVTGATGWLGREICRVLKDNGAIVLGAGRRDRDTVANLDIDHYLQMDLRDDSRFVLDPYRVDILVNNAHDMSHWSGFNGVRDQLMEYSPAQWENNLAELGWVAALVNTVGLGMVERRSGSIINICSMYSLVAPSSKLYEGTSYMNPPAYSVTKAGLLAFTRYIASMWGKYNVRANAICPGPFPNTEKMVTSEAQEFLLRLNSRTCLGRTGRPDELAGAVLFLASEASSYVTGHAIVIDGGWTAL